MIGYDGMTFSSRLGLIALSTIQTTPDPRIGCTIDSLTHYQIIQKSSSDVFSTYLAKTRRTITQISSGYEGISLKHRKRGLATGKYRRVLSHPTTTLKP